MDACKLLVHSLVTIRLDYCNAVFGGVRNDVIRQLERVQRRAARVVLYVQERSDLPPEQQPPRGARRKCGARPLSTANVAGCINTLICPTSIEHSASTYVVHGQRSVGGSPA